MVLVKSQNQMKSDKPCTQKRAAVREKRLTVSIFLILILAVLTGSAFAEAYYETSESEVLGRGIEYFKRLTFDAGGWTQIHYYKVDLTSPDVNMQLLYDSDGLANRNKLSDLVTAQTVGAVNGDFFALTTPSTSIGLALDQGKVLATPSQHAGYSALVIENQLARVFKESITANLIHNGATVIPFEAYNRIHTQFYKVVVLDNKWNNQSIGVSKIHPDMLEIVVVGGVVQEIRDRMPAVALTEGMQVIVANGTNRKTFETVRVGDTMQISIGLNLDESQVSVGLGGGCRVVQNGVGVPFLLDLSSRQPRTAVGIADGGQTLYLMTVDGRSQGYKGMNGNELAQFFIGLGCTDAMIFDGGGSTTFFKRSLGDTVGSVINYLSDGVQRKIVTGLGIENKGVSGLLKGITLGTDGDAQAVVGSSVALTVKGYDEAYQPYTLAPERVDYTVLSGGGQVINGRFYPAIGGQSVVQAQYLGKTAEVTVQGYADIDRIAFETDRKQIKGDTPTSFKVYAYTTRGFKIALAAQDLQWTDTRSLGTVTSGVYLAQVAGETILEARFQGFTARMDLRVGTDQILYDEFDGQSLNVVGSSPQVSFTAHYDGGAYSGNNALTLEYQFKPDANNRAIYAVFNQPIVVDSDVDRIGFYGYGQDLKPNLWIRLLATDAKGSAVTLDVKKGVDWSGWKYLESAIPPDTQYPLTLERLYIVDVAPTIDDSGSISFDRLLGLKKNNYTLLSQLNNKAFTDSQRGVAPTMDPLHAIVPSKASGDTLMDKMLLKQIQAKLSAYERIFVTGSLQKDLLPAITRFYNFFTNSYSADLGDVTVAKFSNKNGGLRRTSATAWLGLNYLEKTATTPAVVVLLDENPFTTQGFYEPKEFKLFKDKLESMASRGKEVVVIYEGSQIGSRLENGVRYIALKKMPTNVNDALNDMYYIEWTLSNGKFIYDYKPLMLPQ